MNEKKRFHYMPKVSIITVCLNSENTIKKTLESVLKQSYKNIEYFIIDGKSQDQTVSIAEKYAKAFQEKGVAYKIISEKDSGLYDAMNKGIYMSSGEIIGIVNSDDWYEPSAIETAVNIYQRRPYDILMCSVNRWKGTKKSIKTPAVRTYKTSRDFCHPAMFVTKKTYEEIGSYNTSLFYADFDFWLRQFRKKRVFVISKKVVTNFRLGGISNEKTVKKMIFRIRDRYRIYRQNGYSKIYLAESILIEAVKMILV